MLSESDLLPREFYIRTAIEVARDCLGKVVVHGRAAGRIVEVEAYLGVNDLAAHSSRGITPRTRIVFGEPGHAYVYFIYGRYDCLNFTSEPEGQAGCVLIRALEPLSGLALMQRRRPTAKRIEDLARGPGRLTMAMGITRRLNGCDLVKGPLTVRAMRQPPKFETGVSPRIGITQCVDWPLRFFVKDSRFVSRRVSARMPK